MALTKDTIKANAVLSGLTEEQVTALVVLSTNDEATQIGARIGELHGRYDTDVFTVTGIAKNQSEKSYDYVKRVLGEYKTKAEKFASANTEIAQLKRDKTDLEKKLTENAGDATVKQKLADTEAKLQQLQTQYDADKAKFDADKAEFETSMHNYKVESQLDNAVSGLKFKSTIPDSVKAVLLKNAKAELFSTTKPEFIDVNGVSTLIFRDKAGQIMNNPQNKLNPFTASELITASLKDVIDFGKNGSGAGSGNQKTRQQSIIDISAANTQILADEIIQKHLLESGLVKTDPAFSEKQAELRKEYKVEKLPLR